jgi:hypothetical protein
VRQDDGERGRDRGVGGEVRQRIHPRSRDRRRAARARQPSERERGVQRAEQTLPGGPLHRDALGVHRDVEDAVRRAHRRHRQEERGDVDGQRRQDDREHVQRRRRQERPRAAAHGQRARHRLRDHQAERRPEQSDAELAGGQVELLLDRGHARVPGAEAEPVEEEDAGDRRPRAERYGNSPSSART